MSCSNNYCQVLCQNRQNYSVLWGKSRQSKLCQQKAVQHYTHCLTALWAVYIMMQWESILTQLLQSALKFYNAVIQSISVMASLYLMNIKDMQSFSIFSWEQRIKFMSSNRWLIKRLLNATGRTASKILHHSQETGLLRNLFPNCFYHCLWPPKGSPKKLSYTK